jgi:hypothetical protein
MIKRSRLLAILMALSAMLAAPRPAAANPLDYECSVPLLEVDFPIAGARYSGAVKCGNLFLQSDIPAAPVVRWPRAQTGKLYLLMMLDFDGNANGSWPDPVPVGENAPVRHWIVANVPGALLRGPGYREIDGAPGSGAISVLQPYRSPHIPMASDRYGVYLFQQKNRIQPGAIPDPITNFPTAAFLATYHLTQPVASNMFVAIYVSESPFSGKPFHGNDLSGTWHHGAGTGRLPPGPAF